MDDEKEFPDWVIETAKEIMRRWPVFRGDVRDTVEICKVIYRNFVEAEKEKIGV